MDGLFRPSTASCVRVCSRFAFAFIVSSAFLLLPAPSSAQEQPSRRTARVVDAVAVGKLGAQMNQNTVAIVSGNPNGTYLQIAYDLSAVLDDGDNLRVLPVVARGGGSNIRDVRFLKGVDMGITQSVLLNRYRRTGEIGKIDDKLVYIAKLFNEEMHLIVHQSSNITSIEQLAGKKVNFSDIGSGTQLSTQEIFTRLGIPAEEVNMGQADAFEKLKSGEIFATVLIAGKPTGSTSKLKLADGFRILPVAYSKVLQEDFLPATLTSDDYPNLIEPGRRVDTVAVSAVLFAYNWPKNTDRYQRIERFVQAFFPRLADFQKPPRHPKWKEANLAATLPGWSRFEAAEEWLQSHRPQPAVAERGQFNEFLAARGQAPQSVSGSPEDRERLFQEFLKWKQARERR